MIWNTNNVKVVKKNSGCEIDALSLSEIKNYLNKKLSYANFWHVDIYGFDKIHTYVDGVNLAVCRTGKSVRGEDIFAMLADRSGCDNLDEQGVKLMKLYSVETKLVLVDSLGSFLGIYINTSLLDRMNKGLTI